MGFNGIAYYQTAKTSTSEYVRVRVLCWFSDSLGNVVHPTASQLPISIDVYKQGAFRLKVKTVESESVDPIGFVWSDFGLPWKSEYGQEVKNSMVVVATDAESNSSVLPLLKTPADLGPWAAVFFENLKLGVLHMTGQVQGLAELINSITDKVRYALQVGPGETMRWCSDHTPALAPSWGDSISWGFSSVGIWIHNFGDVPIEFSFDGQNRHGIVPAGKAKVYDFRRETQIFFRSSSTSPTITLEVW